LGARGAPKVLIIPLAIRQVMTTAASTSTNVYHLVDDPQLRAVGPMTYRMRVHWFAEWCTTNFQGKVSMQFSVTGQTWSTPVTLLSAQTGDGQVIGAWYSTDANFGLNLQVSIDVANSSGTAIENGRVTAYLEVELKS
jgi:hypothetical protein